MSNKKQAPAGASDGQGSREISNEIPTANSTTERPAQQAPEGTQGRVPTIEEIPFRTPDQIADYYGKVAWTWEDWIPQGHLTLIVGPQGCGKSYFAARLVGSLNGSISHWPDGEEVNWDDEKLPAIVLIVETEEMRGVYVQRMDAMGIDRGRYFFGPGDETHIADLLRDADQIEKLAVQESVGAIIIDSLSGGHELKENDAEMRKLLKRLAGIASRLNIPVILVHHPRKRDAIEPIRMTLDRVRGSSTITQFCRSVIALYRAVEDNSAPVRVEVIKTTFCPPPEPLGFTINGRGPEPCDAPEVAGAARPMEAVCDLLKTLLKDGAKRASDIRERVEGAGMSWSTTMRAKKRLNIESRRVEPGNEETGYWLWTPPEEWPI